MKYIPKKGGEIVMAMRGMPMRKDGKDSSKDTKEQSKI